MTKPQPCFTGVGFQSAESRADAYEAGGIEGRVFHFIVDICLVAEEFVKGSWCEHAKGIVMRVELLEGSLCKNPCTNHL